MGKVRVGAFNKRRASFTYPSPRPAYARILAERIATAVPSVPPRVRFVPCRCASRAPAMPPLDTFRRRFAYHHWATHALAAVLLDDETHESARALLAHACTADRVWLLRLRGEPTEGVALWPAPASADIRDLARRNAEAFSLYLDVLTADDLDATAAYRNTKGEAFETAVPDVLDHVLLHGAYHRGQAAAALRSAGTAPPPTDYIAWVRAGEPGASGQ